MVQDSATRLSRKRALSNYTKFLDRDGLNGARIGVARNMAGTNPRIAQDLRVLHRGVEATGRSVIDPADVPNFDKFGKTELEVLHYEFKADLNKYLKSLSDGARVHSMEDVIKFNEENSDKVMPYFGQEHMIAAQEKASLQR
jgi:amidase